VSAGIFSAMMFTSVAKNLGTRLFISVVSGLIG
jgi:hypothetical protein